MVDVTWAADGAGSNTPFFSHLNQAILIIHKAQI